MEKPIIRQVWRNESNGQLLITLPRKKFEKGNYVKISKLNINEKKCK